MAMTVATVTISAATPPVTGSVMNERIAVRRDGAFEPTLCPMRRRHQLTRSLETTAIT